MNELLLLFHVLFCDGQSRSQASQLAGYEQGDGVSGVLEQIDGLFVRNCIQTDSVDCDQLITSLQSPVAGCRAAIEHALDDHREVAPVAAVTAHYRKAKAAVSASTESHLA